MTHGIFYLIYFWYFMRLGPLLHLQALTTLRAILWNSIYPLPVHHARSPVPSLDPCIGLWSPHLTALWQAVLGCECGAVPRLFLPLLAALLLALLVRQGHLLLQPPLTGTQGRGETGVTSSH